MAHAEELARQLFTEAEKKLTSSKSFFQILFGYKNRNTDDAIECYQRAGNLFKLSKNWSAAGNSFLQAANLHTEQNNRCDAANCYVLASKCYQKVNVFDGIKCLLNAIQIYMDLGRFVMAAKLHETIADIYEQNCDFAQAIQHYEQAGDYFKVEENHMAAKKCLLKVAYYYSSQFNNFQKAIGIYQDIGLYDLRSPILHYSANDNFFRALLCHLCVDIVSAKLALSLYIEKFPAFELSKEAKLVKNLIGHIEDGDADAFTQTVKGYDEISKLDSWFTKILLKIKKQIKETPDLL